MFTHEKRRRREVIFLNVHIPISSSSFWAQLWVRCASGQTTDCATFASASTHTLLFFTLRRSFGDGGDWWLGVASSSLILFEEYLENRFAFNLRQHIVSFCLIQKLFFLASAMYADWPLLTLPDFDRTVLDIFSRDCGRLVSAALIRELANNSSDSSSTDITRKCRLQCDEHVNWILQVYKLRFDV